MYKKLLGIISVNFDVTDQLKKKGKDIPVTGRGGP
jgi:hypothetical protein